MPIYEYTSIEQAKACGTCATGFEVIHSRSGALVAMCPECGMPVRRVVSRCCVVVTCPNESNVKIEKTIRGYEQEGRWSHAAELADKQSASLKDEALRTRANENYKKAGYRSLGKGVKKAAVTK